MIEQIITDYGTFLLKTITIVVAIAVLFTMKRSKKDKNEGEIKLTNITEKYTEQQEHLEMEMFGKKAYKQMVKDRQEESEQEHNENSQTEKGRLFVLEYDGDMNASEVASLREEITAVLLLAKANDEVLLKLTSPGGVVYGYGLAASQLKRLREHQIPLTIAVDKVAASGGYMMACVANKIIAAPFSIIGSIGVVATVPNIHRLLKKHDVDVDLMTAGEYKRTVTFIGENTPEGKRKFEEELQTTHHLFKAFVLENRPQIDVEKVATGETWYGTQALELHLVDEISTSDDYILEATHEKEVYSVKYEQKESFMKRAGLQVESSIEKIITKLLNKNSKMM